MTALVLSAPDGFLLKIPSPVLEKLNSYGQWDAKDAEAGGVLLGREILGSGAFVVDALTVPLRGDARHRFWFRRASKPHQVLIDETWRASQGHRGYLGEWHTHPEAIPTPSGTDRADWSRRLVADSVDARFVVFLIVGTGCTNGWRGDRRTGEVVRLHPIGGRGAA